MKNLWPHILTILCITASCHHEELSDCGLYSDTEIRFKATEYGAVLTRSDDEEISQDRMFLGIAGKDSLFLTVSESPMEPSFNAMTKGEGNVPESFHISAFKDEAEAPYLNLKLSSSDGWSSYSPTLYWPNEYENIHFFAYSYNLGNNLISPQFSTSGGYTAEFDYTIPYSETSEDDAEVQPDISFAIAPAQHESKSPVKLDFVHTLAAIEFKIGDIGDATVVKSVTELTNIQSNGHCIITYPVSQESISWTTDSERKPYTQTVKNGVPFMIIPQKISESGIDISFKMSITIGDITHEFPAKSLSSIAEEWKANRKYTYTITKGGEVKLSVRDTNSSTVKEKVQIQNTGFTTSYIRAAIVGYWYVLKDGVEEIASSWDINDDNAGDLSISADWGDHWRMIDGFYYHIAPVSPGDYTAPLFDRYELNATGPVSGSKLNISIAVQAIEKNEATESLWKKATGNNN